MIEGGASAPSLHPHHSRPYDGYELPILIVKSDQGCAPCDHFARAGVFGTPPAAAKEREAWGTPPNPRQGLRPWTPLP
jgi:hypothetical protein